MQKFGIDISKWNGVNFNFDRAIDEGVEFVIVRGAYSCTKDFLFETYYKKAKAKKLPVGVWQYSMAQTVVAAEAEAEYLYKNVLKGKQFELPIYIDVEDKTQFALSQSALTMIVKAWCDYLEKKGYYVGIYSSPGAFKYQMDDNQLKNYTHWLAQWNYRCSYTGAIDMWQFGGDTNKLRPNTIAGGVTDQDYMYKDFPTIIKKMKLNGFGKAPAVQATEYFEKADYSGTSFVEGLRSIGANSDFAYRKTIAKANGIKLYVGTAAQNTALLKKLRQGSLIKP